MNKSQGSLAGLVVGDEIIVPFGSKGEIRLRTITSMNIAHVCVEGRLYDIETGKRKKRYYYERKAFAVKPTPELKKEALGQEMNYILSQVRWEKVSNDTKKGILMAINNEAGRGFHGLAI